MKAASVYDEMITQSQQLKTISGKQSNFWTYFKSSIGIDLQSKTLQLLKNVMQAQALYLKYNNLQLKVAKSHIDRQYGDIG